MNISIYLNLFSRDSDLTSSNVRLLVNQLVSNQYIKFYSVIVYDGPSPCQSSIPVIHAIHPCQSSMPVVTPPLYDTS